MVEHEGLHGHFLGWSFFRAAHRGGTQLLNRVAAFFMPKCVIISKPRYRVKHYEKTAITNCDGTKILYYLRVERPIFKDTKIYGDFIGYLIS